MALKTLTSARSAIEATKGTGITVTRQLYAQAMTWNQTVATILPQELRNSYFQNFRAYPASRALSSRSPGTSPTTTWRSGSRSR